MVQQMANLYIYSLQFQCNLCISWEHVHLWSGYIWSCSGQSDIIL